MRMVVALTVCGLLGLGALPAAAAPRPQRLLLQVVHGSCNTTQLDARAGVPTEVVIIMAANDEAASMFEIPSLRVRSAVAGGLVWTVTQVGLGSPQPGSYPFQLSTPPISGSAAGGCSGSIRAH